MIEISAAILAIVSVAIFAVHALDALPLTVAGARARRPRSITGLNRFASRSPIRTPAARP
jgi:hypothetical protein